MKAQRVLIVLSLSLGLLVALGVCLTGPGLAATQLAVAAEQAAVVSGQSLCITCTRGNATPVEGVSAASEVNRLRERLSLDALSERAAPRRSISRTLPPRSIAFSETMGARRGGVGPEISGLRGLLEGKPLPKRELRKVAWLESARPLISVAATVTLLSEGFETSVPPPGWVEEDVVGTAGDWTRASATVHPSGGGAHGGSYLALFNSGSIPAGAETRLYVANVDLSHTVGSYYVSFWMYHDSSGFNYLFDDRLELEVDDGSGWRDDWEPQYTGRGGVGWRRHIADLSAFRGKTIRLGFRAISGNILDVAIDDVEVYYVPAPPLLVSKTADRLAVAPGAALTYTAVITRGSTTPGASIRLTDTLDAYQRPVSVTTSQGACAINNAGWGGGITCTLGGLAVGASARVTLTAQVTASLPITPLQQITNTVNVTAADGAASAQAAVYIDTCRVRLVEGATITAYPTVQSAIDAALTPTGEVQVAGACFGVETRANVRQAAYVDKTLILRGGYKPDFSEWNTSLYTTYLHAAGLGRTVFISGTVMPLIEGFYLTGGNASAVGSWVDPALGYGGGLISIYAAPTIRRNVITGNDTGNITPDRLGGGILLLGATLPTPARIEDNTVSDNVSGPYLGGGGVAVYASLGPIVARNVISGNVNRLDDWQQVSYGGGLYLLSSDGVTIEDNVIAGNTACYDWMAEMSGASCAGGGLFALDSYHLVVRNNQVIDNSAAREGWFGEGGGMYFGYVRDLDLRENTVQNNAASGGDGGDSSGGGIALYQAVSVTLQDNTLIGNRGVRTTGDGTGGGLYAIIVYTLTLDGNTIRENVATPDGWGSGGGISGIWLDDLTLSNNLVQDNAATQANGPGWGGGIWIGGERLSLTGNMVQGNLAGATRGTGGGMVVEGNSVLLADNVVQDNVGCLFGASVGGGMAVSGEYVTLSRNRVQDNVGCAYVSEISDRSLGGGLYVGAYDATLNGNLVIGNAIGQEGSGGRGGGVFAEGEGIVARNNVISANRGITGSLGAGIYLEHTEATLQHNTIVVNTGGDGSAVYAAEIYTTGLTSLVNNIIAGHAIGVYADTASVVAADGVLWYGNAANTGGPGTVNVSHATTGDPAFGADGYHITSASAAIDQGVDCDVSGDIDGDPRPGGFGFDLGADEIPGPGLRLVKRASAWSLSAGETVTYTIAVTSAGISTATDVRLTDTLPIEQQALAVVTDRGTCTPVAGWGGGFTCTLGDMPPAASAHITPTAQMTTTIPAILPPAMRNVVTATATGTARTAYADTYFITCRARVGGSEFAEIQAAVDAAAVGAVVQVAGLCQGVNSRGGLSQHVHVNKSLTLEGGWNNDFSVRDPSLYPTTLDPQGAGRAVYIANATVVTLTGLSLAHGSAAGLGGYKPGSITYDAGGGLYALNTRLVVSGCVVADGSVYRVNYYGGGLFLNNGDGSTFLNNVFRDNRNAYNSYENRGGGLYAINSDNLLLRGNQFISNQAAWGGGLALVDSTTFTLEDNLVQGNLAVPTTENRGCGLYVYHGNGGILDGNRFLENTICNNGGGAYLEASPNTVIRDNLFQDNSVVSAGGGLYVASSANARLDDNRFLENTGGDYGVGGGLHIASGTGYSLQRNRIQGNTAGYMGAGLYLAASAILSNTVIADNVLSKGYVQGAGAYVSNVNVTLRHATLARNSGGDGSGIYFYGSGRTIALHNVIVAEQMTGIYAGSGNTVNVNGVLWHGNAANTGGGATFNVTNAHTGDPSFGSDGYHLTGASAAMDQGADVGVSDDIDSQTRDAQPDLGADEYVSTGVELIASKSASSLVVNRGDLFTYTIVISNVAKAANATGVIVTDTLPGSQQPLTADASVGPCGIAGTWGGTVTCVPGTIVTRTAVFITITAKLLDAARLGEATINTAIFTSNEMSGTAQATIYAQDCRARLNDATTEYTTVQVAVDAAVPDDLVKVAGVCLGAFERGGLRQQVYLDKSLTLRGGYSKSNWNSPDPSLTPTTLDALGQGRVFYVTGAISPTIEDLRITGGDATGLGGQGGYDGAGGGIYVTGAAPAIRQCAIYGNVASRAGLGGGGGAYLLSSAAALSDNVISGNTASTAGRGEGGGLALSNSNANLIGNTIQENVANRTDGDGEGGGIYMEQAAPALHNNLIRDNTASVAGWGAGGGVYATWRNGAWLSNTVLSGNVSGASPTSRGNGLFVDFLSSPRLLHTTLHSNTGGYGSGIEVDFYSSVALTNTILVSQTEGIFVASDSAATLDGVLWHGNAANTAGAGPVTVTNAHTGAPAFAADGYHLTAGSAAIGRGVAAGVSDDIDGQPRDAPPDLGADEFYSSAAPALSISRSGNDVRLAWTHNATFSGYQVWYSSADFYFTPGADCNAPPAGLACAAVAAPTSSFTHAGAAADLTNNYAYLLLGVEAGGARSEPSNRGGEFGFGLTPGTP